MADVYEIPLSRGLVALVDAEDYPRLSQHRWHATKGNHGAFYAARELGPRGKVEHIYMHREILGLLKGDRRQGDHVDREKTLDNRRSNLRISTPAQNRANQGHRIDNSSGYRGVSWDKRKNKYSVKLQYHRRTLNLGWYEKAEVAALVYDRKALELWGEFAFQNFPGGKA